jgi:hypothetical protein
MCYVIDSFNQGFYVKMAKIKGYDYRGFSIQYHALVHENQSFFSSAEGLGQPPRADTFSTVGLRLDY